MGNPTRSRAGTRIAKFLLRLYVEKRDPKYRPALDKAIQFVIDGQYPIGGWPQRFPLDRDYTAYITFNDDVAAENIDFLIACYQALGDPRVLDTVNRGMNAFLVTQQGAPQPGWALQYTLDLKPPGARTYEPKALVLPPGVATPANRTHPTFIELGTNKPLYVHREGSNVVNGRYFIDYNPRNTIAHYGSFRRIDVADLRQRYQQAKALAPADAAKDSPLLAARGLKSRVLKSRPQSKQEEV
jgi:pectate lyase-like protein